MDSLSCVCITANLGVCPSTRYEAEVCAWIRFVSCADDSDCANNEKCCSNGCGLQCMAPVTAKPGVCPSTSYVEVMCFMKGEELCADDSECPNNEKCCGTACGGTQCTAPVTANPGVCPSRTYEPGMCALIRFVSCADDSDCANNEKCCSNGCGLQCMAPVTAACRLPIDAGPCEAYMPRWAFDSAAGKCVSFIYGGCKGNGNRFNSQKECEESCGVRNVNPGVCPSRKYERGKCTLIRFVPCADDSDCANNEKCCSNGCGLQCMAPVTAACRLPIDAGPCEAYMPRWAFDSAAGKCVSFIYGGCKGNGNRFNSQKECEESCGVRNVKPGVCPRRKYESAMCARIRFVSCVNDSDCANNEKCCSNGCGLQCMAPVTAKPGVCPIRKYKPVMCPLKHFLPCADDSDCASNEKCCSNGCGLQCMAPVTVKPGVCPSRTSKPGMCPLMHFMSCVDDSDCANNEKCCSNGCGLDCMAPVTANPGVCPSRTYEPGMCALIRFVSCADDSDCANNEKCCSNGCGLQCMAPVTAACRLPIDAGPCEAYMPMWAFDSAAGKCVSFIYGGCKGNGNRFNSQKECEESCGVRNANPGVCPSTRYEAEVCTWIRFVSCVNDSDCANNQKCCSNGCGLQCMAPVTAKPGVCPITNDGTIMCLMKGEELCAGDSECPNNQKCCSTMCNGLDCMDPVTVKPGVCPKTNSEIRCIKKDEELCADDSECPKNLKCCRTACGGTQCTAPVTAKPGVCPKTKSELVKCIMIGKALCADDSECPKNQKCCGTACGGTQCTAPVTAKPGVCPKTKSELVKCVKKGEELCADDSECPKNLKCCRTACGGTQCTAPVTAKPGVCPKTKSELVKCIMIGKALCAGDSECPKNLKCCGTACGGTQCTAPVTAKPGVCPKTNAEVMCKKKGEELCADDSECPKNLKCCRTACDGTQCTAPVTAKPGVCPKTKSELVKCVKKGEELCADDSECPKNLKCCRTACGGTQCTAPVTDTKVCSYFQGNTKVVPGRS
ncbi:papilin-like [Rhinichthys klamathensis goyatoka]|uniref:papilin-like n=1 Tax=Rhinichthys klamathensis goyatoka TaxID=3034132 RepID=UPI0024B4F75F|nr:papilin-like [Rhinichthys klamathensis goyatoka]